MDEIEMIPDPRGRWVMMCPCDVTEIRASNGPSWSAFDLLLMEETCYRIACNACGHVTVQRVNLETASIKRTSQIRKNL